MSFILNAKLKLQAPSSSELQAARSKIDAGLKGVVIPTKLGINAQEVRKTQVLTKSLKETKKAATESAESMEDFGRRIGIAGKRYLAFSIATLGAVKALGALRDGLGAAIDFERQILKVGQVSGRTLSQLSGLRKEIFAVTTNIGIDSSEISEAAVTLAQTGKPLKAVREDLNAIAKSRLAPTFGSAKETVEGLIAVQNQFTKSNLSATQILDKFNTIASKFPVEAQDLTVAVQKAGGAFSAAGGDVDELLALFSAVRSSSRESADTIGTAFRTITGRLGRIKTLDFFKEELGVNLLDSGGKILAPFQAIEKIVARLKDLGGGEIDAQTPLFSRVVEELGGIRQRAKIIPILTQLSKAEDILNASRNAGGSIAKDAVTAQAALGVQVQKVREEFARFIDEVIQDPNFKKFADTLLTITKGMIRLANAAKTLIPLIGAVGATFGTSAIGSLLKGSLGGVPGLGGAKKFNTGGLVPGVGIRDTIPALLAPGEVVLNGGQQRKLAGLTGVNSADLFSQAGVPGFQSGGALGAAKNFITERPGVAGAAAAGGALLVGGLGEADDGLQKIVATLGSVAAQTVLLNVALQNGKTTVEQREEAEKAAAATTALVSDREKTLEEIRKNQAKLSDTANKAIDPQTSLNALSQQKGSVDSKIAGLEGFKSDSAKKANQELADLKKELETIPDFDKVSRDLEKKIAIQVEKVKAQRQDPFGSKKKGGTASELRDEALKGVGKKLPEGDAESEERALKKLLNLRQQLTTENKKVASDTSRRAQIQKEIQAREKIVAKTKEGEAARKKSLDALKRESAALDKSISKEEQKVDAINKEVAAHSRVGQELKAQGREQTKAIANARTLQKEAEKTAKRRAAFNKGVVVAGAVAQTVGSFASNIGEERLAKGDESGVAFAQGGGALQGAVAGAAAGAIIGPFGAAIGGTIGALVGLTRATEQAEKALSDKRDSDLKAFLEQTKAGKLDFGGKEQREFLKGLKPTNFEKVELDIPNQGRVQLSGNEARSRDVPLLPFFEDKVETQFENSIKSKETGRDVRSGLVDQIKFFDTFDKFQDEASGTIQKTAQLLNLDLDLVIAGLRKDFDEAKKLDREEKAFNRALSKAQTAIFKNFANINSFLGAVRQRMEAVQQINSQISVVSGGGPIQQSISKQVSNVRDIPGSARAGLNRSVQQTTGAFGRAGAEVGDQFAQFSNVIPKVKGFVIALKNLGDVSADQLQDAEKKLLAGTSGKTRQALEASLKEIFNVTSDQVSIDLSNLNVGDTINKILKEFGPVEGAVKELVQVFDTQVANLRSNFAKVSALEEKSFQARLKEVSIQGQGRDIVSNLTGAPKSFAAADKTRQLVTGGRNVSQLGAQVRQSTENINRANENAEGKGQIEIAEIIARETAERNKAIEGLKFLTDVTNSTAKAQEAFRKAEADRLAKKSIIEQKLTGDPATVAKITQNESLLSSISQGEVNAGDLSKKAFTDLLEFSKKFGDAVISQTGKTGKETADQLLVQRAKGQDLGISGLTPQESARVEDLNRQIKNTKTVDKPVTKRQEAAIEQKDFLVGLRDNILEKAQDRAVTDIITGDKNKKVVGQQVGKAAGEAGSAASELSKIFKEQAAETATLAKEAFERAFKDFRADQVIIQAAEVKQQENAEQAAQKLDVQMAGTVDLNVIITGAKVFEDLEPQFVQLATREINKAMAKINAPRV